MVMALDAADFFIRNFGALRFGTAAMRPLLIPWQLPEDFQSTKGRCRPNAFLVRIAILSCLKAGRATRIFVKRHKI